MFMKDYPLSGTHYKTRYTFITPPPPMFNPSIELRSWVFVFEAVLENDVPRLLSSPLARVRVLVTKLPFKD